MATRRRCAPPRSGSPESGTARVRSFGGISRMDIRKIKKLIELLEESGIAEIEIKEGEEAVRISRMPPAGHILQLPQYTHVAASLPMPMSPSMETPAKTSASAVIESPATKPKP